MQKIKLVPFLVTAFIVLAELAISFNSTLLPNLKADFYISEQFAQMTIGVGLFAIGFSGIIYGGLTNSFGRRPMFLFSVSTYCITALICALAPNGKVFLVARFFQGVGSGAGWVIGNACLKDIFHGKQYFRVINYTHAVAGITPAVAPIIGSYIAVAIGWRICFIGLFVISAIAAISMYFFQVETIENKQPINFSQILSDYRSVFTNKEFMRYCSLKVIAVTMIFTEIANIPLVFVNYLSVPPQQFGLYMLPVFSCYVVSSLVSSQLKIISTDTLLRIGLVLLFFSNLAIILLQQQTNLSAIDIQSIKSLSYLGWGCIFGNATAKIVSCIPGKAGMLSALMIALEMILSSIGIYIASLFFNGTIVPLATFLCSAALLALTIFQILKD